MDKNSSLDERAAAPTFKDAEELAAWLDSLHESDASGTVSSRKWEPAQRAAAAIRAAAPAPKPANLEDAPEGEQEWAKVDPATAFHLIERHAENWADAGRMMLAWRDANPAPATASGDELPPILTMKAAFESVGGWYNGGETGYPSFGSAEALWRYTEKMQRNAVDRARAAVSAATKPTDPVLQQWQQFQSALSQCAELLKNMSDGDSLLDTPKFLAAALADAATKPAAAADQSATIIGILQAQIKRMEEQQNAHRPAFLLNGTRFKLNFSSRGNVDVFHNYAAELQGRWVALVPAEDDCHLTPAASTTGAAQTAEQEDKNV